MNNYSLQSGSGPHIVFLHGWKQNKESWTGVIHELEHNFTCTSLDMPGFGINARPSASWSPVEYATWVYSELSKLNIAKCTVIGHSFGGRVAIELAALSLGNNPIPGSERLEIERVVLEGTPGYRQPISHFTSWSQAMVKALKKSNIAFDKMPGYTKLQEKMRSTDYQNSDTLKDIFLATIEHNLEPAMLKMKQPTLLVWGENDEEVPVEIARAMENSISQSELKIMPGLTHFAHSENPRLFAGIVREFINQEQ